VIEPGAFEIITSLTVPVNVFAIGGLPVWPISSCPDPRTRSARLLFTSIYGTLLVSRFGKIKVPTVNESASIMLELSRSAYPDWFIFIIRNVNNLPLKFQGNLIYLGIIHIMSKKQVKPKKVTIQEPEPDLTQSEIQPQPKPRKSRAKPKKSREELLKELQDSLNEIKQEMLELKEDESKVLNMGLKRIPKLIQDELSELENDQADVEDQFKKVQSTEEQLNPK